MFSQRLVELGTAVERRLGDLLDAKRPGAIEAGRLGEAMRYATFNGGKRFRPFLVVETARLFGVPEAKALNVAAALECIHCYSLVHDDLPAMDNDDLRRGLPTVHKKFDEATAILAGDGLLTFAFEILGRSDTDPIPPSAPSWCSASPAPPVGKACAAAEMLDLEAEGVAQDLDGIARIQALKTGALIRFAAEAGAVLGRASEDERKAVVAYAEALGLAFQVSDDLLDAEGDAAAVGKATGKDAAAGKATFVSLLGLAEAKAKLASLEETAIQSLARFGDRAALLQDAARFMAQRKS